MILLIGVSYACAMTAAAKLAFTSRADSVTKCAERAIWSLVLMFVAWALMFVAAMILYARIP